MKQICVISPMRAGSTWLTELLCTGLNPPEVSGYDYIGDKSYFDKPIDKRSLVAKSHSFTYDGSIRHGITPYLIIRNLYDSLISYFNYNYKVMPNENRKWLPDHETFFNTYSHVTDIKELVNLFILHNKNIPSYISVYSKYLEDYKANINGNVVTYEQMIFNPEITLQMIVDKLNISDIFNFDKAINSITLSRFKTKKTEGFCDYHKSGHYADILYPETIEHVKTILN